VVETLFSAFQHRRCGFDIIVIIAFIILISSSSDYQCWRLLCVIFYKKHYCNL